MVTVNDIFRFLDELAPFADAEEWDNSGLLIGCADANVETAVVSLDCNAEAIRLAEEAGARLIITHHPVIFDPLRSLDDKSYVWRLARGDISVISAHTNLDKAEIGVNARLCERLNFRAAAVPDCPFLMRADMDSPLAPDQLALRVKDALGCAALRYYAAERSVKSVAVCCGSGGDMLCAAAENGCDALVTGDVKHNVFIDAERLGVTLIDAGHFCTEDVVVEPLCAALSKRFPSVKFITSHAYPVKTI